MRYYTKLFFLKRSLNTVRVSVPDCILWRDLLPFITNNGTMIKIRNLSNLLFSYKRIKFFHKFVLQFIAVLDISPVVFQTVADTLKSQPLCPCESFPIQPPQKRKLSDCPKLRKLRTNKTTNISPSYHGNTSLLCFPFLWTK